MNAAASSPGNASSANRSYACLYSATSPGSVMLVSPVSCSMLTRSGLPSTRSASMLKPWFVPDRSRVHEWQNSDVQMRLNSQQRKPVELSEHDVRRPEISNGAHSLMVVAVPSASAASRCRAARPLARQVFQLVNSTTTDSASSAASFRSFGLAPHSRTHRSTSSMLAAVSPSSTLDR